jgi:hypothetical protein
VLHGCGLPPAVTLPEKVEGAKLTEYLYDDKAVTVNW